MKPIFENRIGRFFYDAERKLVLSEYYGAVKIEYGLELFTWSLQFSQANPVIGHLADTTQLKGSFTKLNDYLVKEHFPTQISRRLRFTAIVLSEDVFVTYAANQLAKKLGSFELQLFHTRPSAETWVDQQLLKLAEHPY